MKWNQELIVFLKAFKFICLNFLNTMFILPAAFFTLVLLIVSKADVVAIGRLLTKTSNEGMLDTWLLIGFLFLIARVSAIIFRGIGYFSEVLNAILKSYKFYITLVFSLLGLAVLDLSMTLHLHLFSYLMYSVVFTGTSVYYEQFRVKELLKLEEKNAA